MKGKVIKAFPFAYDGINVTHLAAGQDFPPAGQRVASATFDGLVKAEYIEAGKADELPAEEQLNRQMIEAFDRRLMAASDQDLKDIIARSGTPYSGNMVHAQLVMAAKRQMLAEMEGAVPILGINPNSGVTEQPLAAPGQATPPSAATAVEQQKAQQDAAGPQDPFDHDKNGSPGGSLKKGETTAQTGAGENKATNQFGDPMPSSGAEAEGETKLDEMTVAELKEHAEKNNIDLEGATKKDDILAAVKKSGK